MYTKNELEIAYESVLNSIEQYPIMRPLEKYATWNIILNSARFVHAPQLLNTLLWDGKITIEQHANLYDQLHSDDAENWLVVFAFIKTLKDVH